jgi:hypothetical protein
MTVCGEGEKRLRQKRKAIFAPAQQAGRTSFGHGAATHPQKKPSTFI